MGDHNFDNHPSIPESHKTSEASMGLLNNRPLLQGWFNLP